jgi:hypothetical protein
LRISGSQETKGVQRREISRLDREFVQTVVCRFPRQRSYYSAQHCLWSGKIWVCQTFSKHLGPTLAKHVPHISTVDACHDGRTGYRYEKCRFHRRSVDGMFRCNLFSFHVRFLHLEMMKTQLSPYIIAVRLTQQQNFDAIAVIIAGVVIGGWFYPFYKKKTGKPMKLAHKFAIGTFLGTLGMVCKLSVSIIDFYKEHGTIPHLRIAHPDALLIDVFIIKVFNESGSAVNILWQSPGFHRLRRNLCQQRGLRSRIQHRAEEPEVAQLRCELILHRRYFTIHHQLFYLGNRKLVRCV